ncbi:CAP domain-containing protein [Cytobacillus gottheilii]|uniref:CAP domain-containing protein n=1 Tax=Cytobacillus gottheilii TaxID=859144 RepID=UPI0009B944B9|nr:CAP domain-containing protein [Cytobacillus gottheilii]
MRKLIVLSLFVAVLYTAWPALTNEAEQQADASVLENLKNDLLALKESEEVSTFFTSFKENAEAFINDLVSTFQGVADQEQQQDEISVEQPELTPPDAASFSIMNIEMGDSRSDIENKLGKPERSTSNEYGQQWHTYHDNYHNFVMVTYMDDLAAGLYSNQDVITSSYTIAFGSDKQAVLEQLGTPLSKIRKGFTYYQFEEVRDYDIFELNDSYVTVFYDQHNDHKVKAMQIIDGSLEAEKSGFYGEPNEALMEGFEYQLFDITNAERVSRGINALTWDDHVRVTARKHSDDMAENNYFDHNNLEGESPFDRMKEDNLVFRIAGENLASGQFSSIFAHEGLMNSLGHRENILRDDYEYLGVGVAFNENRQPYYTENFYTD